MLTDSFAGTALSVAVALLVATVAYFKWRYQYWQRKNVPYAEPRFPFGNSGNPLQRKEHVSARFKRHYDHFKARGHKHGGLFNMLSPSYLVVDLDYVRNIMTKDFQFFVDRGIYYNERDDPLSAHLFAIGGAKWRKLRTKLTPTFTSGKMKMMFQTLVDCIPNLLENVEEHRVRREPIDIKEVLGCFTTDIIGSCAFGLECNTFKEENSPFREYGRKFFAGSKLNLIKMLFASNFPKAAEILKLRKIAKDVSEFFFNVVKDTVEYRERDNVRRNDFIQILIDLKNNSLGEEEGLTLEELAAQCFVFFVAGFETSSTAMTFALYELSRHPHLQNKLRNEIDTLWTKYGGKITYDAIQEMKYMDQVINETLRKYPPVAVLTRRCVKDYKIPDQDVIIEKGRTVIIPVLAIHYDEEYYPEPERFDPERFTEENKNSRHHFAHIPFGEGPRLCIGMRFGMMQTKVGLATLLRTYKFSVNSKTQEPLKMKIMSFVLAAEGEIWLDAEKI